MWNIEKKEINKLEFVKQKAIDFLKKTWELQEYKKVIPVKITDKIFAIKSETWNISFYMNTKWEQLFSTLWIYKDLWEEKYNKYLKKLWYKEIKDKTWYYHMINIKTWKEVSQESLKYYEIFEILSNVDERIFIVSKLFKLDEILNKFKSIWKEKTWKDKELNEQYKNDFLEIAKAVTDKYIEKAIKSNVIKPVEIYLFLKYWVITDQETKKYLKQTLTFEYLSNLINNQAIDLVWEQGSIPVTLDWKTYKITFWPITKEELDYYKAKNWINEKMYEELLKILEEHKKLEERKKKEEEKHIEATKQEISGLKGEVEK